MASLAKIINTNNLFRKKVDNNKKVKQKKLKANPLKVLMKMFQIGLNKKRDTEPNWNKLRPLDRNFVPENFPTHVEEFWRYWINNCHDDAESYRNFVKVCEDMDLIYYNDPIFSRAINLKADEVVQADLNTETIGIEAPKKQKEFLSEFHKNINLDSWVRPIVKSTIQYGNCGVVLSMNDKGVEELIPINIYDFKSILDFTPYQIKEKQNDRLFKRLGSEDRWQKLINSILNKDNYASYFKSYTLGYQVGDYVLPPWRFLHFRNKAFDSPFKPWGEPEYIFGMSSYRQYDAAMTLQVVAREANLPIDIYKVKASNIADPVSKVQFVLDFIRNIQNSGLGTMKKEDSGVGETIFTVEDLFEYDQKSSNIDLGKVDDLEMLWNAKVIASGIPRNIIDPNDSAFGDSGVSLIQKFKPFARSVYRYQTIVLDQITQLDKIHMIQSGEFSSDEIDFILTMPYPESQMDSELISNQGELITLANDIIDTIAERIFGEDVPVPKELVQAVYHQILPYDQKRIDSWFNILKREKEKMNNVTDKNSFEYSDIQDRRHDLFGESIRLVESRYNKRNLRQLVEKTIFEHKVKKIKNGVVGNKHCYSSRNVSDTFRPELLREWQKEEISIKSSKKKKSFNEEIKYTHRK